MEIKGNAAISAIEKTNNTHPQETQQSPQTPAPALISNETSFMELLEILNAKPEVAIAALEEKKEEQRAERVKRLRAIYGKAFDKLADEEEKKILEKKTRRPGAVQLQSNETLIARIEISGGGCCEVYANGYAVYDNGDRRTVIWVPGCGSAFYSFTKLKNSEKNSSSQNNENGEKQEYPMMDTAIIEDEVFWGLSWYHAVVIAGENQIEQNLRHPKSRGTTSKQYKKEDWEEKPNYRWTCGSHFEGPEEAYLKKEATEERKNALTEKQREAYELYYEEGYTQEEIGEKLHIDHSAVSLRLSSAKKKLASEKEKYFS